ncbi:MAG: M24 family metallopeptidase [Longimicrobiales bacterium]|nr:M24 family metallopeptidase [Longimicrobiales bacterium]
MTPPALLTTRSGVDQVQAALRERDLDGWMLYEFRGQNWISAALLGTGWTTRRSYVVVPARGEPVALVHAIESAAWRHWPWERRSYAGWQEMEAQLGELVSGRGRYAVEFSPGAAVPTVDLVPAGTLELLRKVGVDPVSSGDLISLFFSVWNEAQLAEHRATAETIAEVARASFVEAARGIGEGSPHTEGSLTRWIVAAMERGGVRVEADTHVAVDAGAADPHYAPDGEGETIGAGQVLLVDLWGRPHEEAVFADQTWMGWMGPTPPERVRRVWEIVRDARDVGVALLEARAAAGEEVHGYEVDAACRAHIASAGHGEHFIHRTGHSMDRKLHGSGPNLDDLETRDDRILVPGVGFSIEPGIYLPGDFGVRSEVNVHFGTEGPEVTPGEIQRDLFTFDV